MPSPTDVHRWVVRLLAGAGLCVWAALGTAVHGFPASKPAAQVAQPAASAAPAAAATSSTTKRQRLVDINSASKTELKTLPGIGDVEAERIVTHRPYATKTHLVEKQVLGVDRYHELSRLIVVEHRGKASRPKQQNP